MTNSRLLPIILSTIFTLAFVTQCYAQTNSSEKIDLQTVKNEIVTLINVERSKSEYKSADIRGNEKLAHIAQTFADDHVDPDGNTCRERAKRRKRQIRAALIF